MSIINPNETFFRHDSVVGDVNVKQRLVDLLAVPWDQETVVGWRGETWREVFRPGAFDGLAGHAGRILVTRDHEDDGRANPKPGPIVGKLVQVDPSHSGGLFARAKIAETSLGDETLALAEEDMLSPSVGYRIKEKSDINIHHRTRLREVMRAFLDHVSLVGYPAYRGAQVLAVREEQSEPAGDLPPGRKALDEAYANPTYLWALERLNS